MDEHFYRLYTEEEEFLDGFGDWATAAAELLKGDWEPNYHCNDRVRTNRSYFKSSGELKRLVFESAGVFRDVGGVSSVQIVLCSSTRTVTVRVQRLGPNLLAEKIVDRVETA